MATGEVDNPERPVREQLKKASLDNQNEVAASISDEARMEAGRGLSKKRSHEAIDGEPAKEQNGMTTAGERTHTRKRSRDSTAEDDEIEVPKKRSSSELGREEPITSTSRAATPEAQIVENAKDPSDDIASPKNKRSRLQNLAGTQDAESAGKQSSGGGFANTSATSPFGTVAEGNKDQLQTSASAFAASKFSSLANGPSAFSSAPRAGGFSSFAKTTSSEASSGDKDVVGTNGSQNGFGGFKSVASGSVFGGSAFGSLNKAEGLTSFKSAQPATAQKPAKAFGTSADDDEEDDNADEKDEPGMKSPISVGAAQDKKDERFYEQEVETGEEGEEVVWSGRAKLYTFVSTEGGKKEWKERGLGVLKLNTKRGLDDGLLQSTAEEPTAVKRPTARFLMRADGSHRVVLNTAVTSTLTNSIVDKGPTANGAFIFTGTIAGASEPQTLQLKMKQHLALELYDRLLEMQQEM
ncbi:hypothetical protein AMS68_005924 [Peltaster fructicola]|uniref:RanBD1 domain-containing protein n=1 Tax=Peltaster fructicola TaxID=286661 RepID=A0A6H0Y073_9PEZI|nr:hypothetical protein AMS68_005924 [Peltaster fructicola]